MTTTTKTTSSEKLNVIDISEVYGEYIGKKIFLAINKTRTRVIATGKTPQSAYENAEREGYKYPIIMLAPPSESHAFLL